MLSPFIESQTKLNYVLCWLASTDTASGMPNVSPKEMWLVEDTEHLLIAHIASPVSVRNIAGNPKVCVSILDILVQKGFKMTGEATILWPNEDGFEAAADKMTKRFSSDFPILAIIRVSVTSIQSIIAPSYFLFPESTSESSQKEAARLAYDL